MWIAAAIAGGLAVFVILGLIYIDVALNSTRPIRNSQQNYERPRAILFGETGNIIYEQPIDGISDIQFVNHQNHPIVVASAAAMVADLEYLEFRNGMFPVTIEPGCSLVIYMPISPMFS